MSWTGFTRHFTHLKSGDGGRGPAPAADDHPGRRHQPGPDQDGRVLPRHDLRQAVLVAGLAHPRRDLLGRRWPSWSTRSSASPSPRTGATAPPRRRTASTSRPAAGRQFAGQVNPKYGQEPGVQFYTHISDQYAPFHTKVINADGARCDLRARTACSTTSPTCGSRSTTPTRPASPTMCSP